VNWEETYFNTRLPHRGRVSNAASCQKMHSYKMGLYRTALQVSNSIHHHSFAADMSLGIRSPGLAQQRRRLLRKKQQESFSSRLGVSILLEEPSKWTSILRSRSAAQPASVGRRFASRSAHRRPFASPISFQIMKINTIMVQLYIVTFRKLG
jgi:hypothetical protein